ncbi:unnamed protein product [Kuraishia capsulata CBS 1993]|uniref:WLM domain-containing protein n=1 Tax=Kuraishia capsulata CBS 1993 TaxID=1382522 RepID=W6MPB1_9ASCO|nr:uncharacterized protein KUCA_T00004464001 [Kuraishia capsulata CBS 1993]CDK28481.1 unnamed protein product [Kuraishia capsulata CBS 1993]
MVVKGRFSKRARKQESPHLKSPTDQISKIASLQKLPQRDEALRILHDIAIQVAPLMREHGFKVGLLCEFNPRSPNLLGLNVNHGSKVCIRLRPANNLNTFMPMGELVGTMLHELTHNRFGPHDAAFYGFLDKLRTRFEEIQVRGALETTGYVGFNNVLGGSFRSNASVNVNSARLKKLAIAGYKSERRKLGGEPNGNSGKSMRELIAEATERRLKDSKWCGEETENAPEDDELVIIDITEEGEFEKEESDKIKKTEKDEPKRKRVKSQPEIEIVDLTSD